MRGRKPQREHEAAAIPLPKFAEHEAVTKLDEYLEKEEVEGAVADAAQGGGISSCPEKLVAVAMATSP